MSDFQDQEHDSALKTIFKSKNLTGFDIARNSQVASKVKRDSSDFALEVIQHERGREIVCELVDVALRPRLLLKQLERERKQTEKENSHQIEAEVSQGQNFTQFLSDKPQPMTEIIYNAIQILTNQYEQFVQFIFDDPKKQLIDSGNLISSEKIKQSFHFGFKEDDKQLKDQLNSQREQWEDCVVMQSGYPQLTRNQQDQILQKLNSTKKLSLYDSYHSQILDRMFLLFQQPIPIDETPVSYLNKIMLQFVYQKPQEIMRYLYCDEKTNAKNVKTCQNVRKIARHLYNHSVIELLAHVMELESEGNFFPQQKAQILKAITEEVFTHQLEDNANKKTQNGNKQSQQQVDQQTSTTELLEDRIGNYILFLKALYQKLQDRYQQEKFLWIFKQHFNDSKLFQRIIEFFKRYNYFDINGLTSLLIQKLKLDEKNFRLQKALQHSQHSFGGSSHNFSFHNKHQESSINSYDLKLSKEILDIIESVIITLSHKQKLQGATTTKMTQYYDLLHCWLNVTIQTRQQFARNLITPRFINDCLVKMKTHQKATILHNSIKNILVDFLPKLTNPLNIILAPQCALMQFIKNYFDASTDIKAKHNKNKKCYDNQLFHIAKIVISIWQQHKILNSIKKTDNNDQQNDQTQQGTSIQHTNYLTTDSENIARFQRLKFIIQQKQQFYDHLICGDPRKINESQEEESEIVMASSFKNFFKPTPITNDDNNLQGKLTGNQVKNRYADDDDDESKKQSSKADDLKQETNLKTDPKFKSLKIGLEHNNSLFDSAISPLNANRSHTFNFDFDALPLDSDSEQAMSQQEDLPLRQNSGHVKQEQMKLMQENIENFDMVGGNVFTVQSNNLSSNNSTSQQQTQHGLLNCDNYRRDQLSKSMEIQDLETEPIHRIDSCIAIQLPNSEDDNFSLGMDSKNSGSKISEENQGSKVDNFASDKVPSFMKEELKENSTIKMDEKKSNEMETLNTNFVKHYSSYLKYDADKLCMDME